MKFFSFALLAVAATLLPSAKADTTPPPGTEILTDEDGDSGYCWDDSGFFDWSTARGIVSATDCHNLCQQVDTTGLLGFSWSPPDTPNANQCVCKYDNGMNPVSPGSGCGIFDACSHGGEGEGPLEYINTSTSTRDGYICYRYITRNAESTGDPHCKYKYFRTPIVHSFLKCSPLIHRMPTAHFTCSYNVRTWKNEHFFEFHGQCDVYMTSVKDFTDQGVGLDIHLRTNMVRYWSYIKSVAIRIGNDILEVEGSAAVEDGEDKRHYRVNYEYRGPLTSVGGFPVTINPRNNKYTIDLDSKYPGQKIEIKTFKEFVGVKIIGANEDSFGNAVGITGNFKTGKTLARDGHTVLHDFNDLGLEWQVLPSDGKLFHEMARPQFPELCFLPEDPRGERARRRLAESNITEEAAAAACAGLKDEFDRKGCIYDILATQDMDMAGAY